MARRIRLLVEARGLDASLDEIRASLTDEEPAVRKSTVAILDGPDAPQQNLALFRVMQNRPSGPLNWYGDELDEPAFLARMTAEQRLVYEFSPTKAYGPG